MFGLHSNQVMVRVDIMADPALLDRGVLLPSEDILSLLESSPRKVEHYPVTPRQRSSSASRPSSAGHTPRHLKTGLRSRPMSSPARLPTSHSVSFLENPVSSIHRYESSDRESKAGPRTPESSPFNPLACFKSPEDERSDRPPHMPQKIARHALIPSLPRSVSFHTAADLEMRQMAGLEECREIATSSGLPDSPLARTATAPIKDRSARVNGSPTPLRRDPPATQVSRAPMQTSPFEPRPEPARRQSMDTRAQNGSMASTQPNLSSLTAPIPAATQAQVQSRRHNFLKRAQNSARNKIFGAQTASASGLPQYHDKSTSNFAEIEAFSKSTLDHGDLDDTFRLVQGCITFDREIKMLFRENAGLVRIWNDEAVPLYRKGDKKGFFSRVERLQMAMSALAGKSVVFG